jgi:hypothetical protein
MTILNQLEFDFHLPLTPQARQEQSSWRERHLARRYRLSPAQAALYGRLMGLPIL